MTGVCALDKEIINWKELLYPYEQTVEELMLKFNYIKKEYMILQMIHLPIQEKKYMKMLNLMPLFLMNGFLLLQRKIINYSIIQFQSRKYRFQMKQNILINTIPIQTSDVNMNWFSYML